VKLDLGNLDFSKLIPLLGDMTEEQKQDFLIRLTEAAFRGFGEGLAKGAKDS